MLIACADKTQTIYLEPCVDVNVTITQSTSDTGSDEIGAGEEQPEAEFDSTEQDTGEFLMEDTGEFLMEDDTGFEEEPEEENEDPAETEPPSENVEKPIDQVFDFPLSDSPERSPEDLPENNSPNPNDEEIELHEVAVKITADDQWTGWINSESFGSNGNFKQVSNVNFELPAGHHIVAIKAKDVGYSINGLIASVHVDGELYSVTGDEQWLASDQQPSSLWKNVDYNDDSWEVAQKCTASYMWQDEALSLQQQGADWVWHNYDCKRNLGTTWFRLHLVIE